MKTAAFVLILLVTVSSSAFGDDWIVNSTLDRVDVAPGDGICSTGGTLPGGAVECTLRAAVQEANARRFGRRRHHQIYVPAGVYPLRIAASPIEEEQQRLGRVSAGVAVQTGDIDIDSDLTISGDGPGLTIIDGNDLDRVFDIWSGYSQQASFQHMTIQNGSTPGPGGCLFHRGGSTGVRLFSVAVEGCVSEQVGGGMLSEGFTELMRVTFRGNRALRGGGFENGRVARIQDSTFDRNSAIAAGTGAGGGLSNIAVHGPAPEMVIRNTTISNNSADWGGGLLNHGGMSLINSTVSGNGAFHGAGIAYFDAPTPAGRGTENLVVYYATIANNGGLGILRSTAEQLWMSHTIVAGNTAGNCEGGYSTSSYNLEDGTGCGFTGEGDISGADPLLGPLADNGGWTLTRALLSGSPAIDAGRPRVSEPTDQRGVPRPIGAASDIGAFEAGMDPRMLSIDVPLRWDMIFEGPLTQAVTYQLSMSLQHAGKNDGSGTARILGVKAADGQGQLKYELDKSGRSLTVTGIAIPPKPGAQTVAESPVLFYVEVQRPLRGAALLRIKTASCDCAHKPAHWKPIVIKPYKPAKK